MWRVSKSSTTQATKRKRHPRKRERGSSTHVINQALRPTLAHLATVNKRLDAGRRVYNACLGESLARCNHILLSAHQVPVLRPPPLGSFDALDFGCLELCD